MDATTEPRQTLALAHADRMAELVKMARPNIARMCAYFYRAADMDRALGYRNSVAGWLAGRAVPTHQADKSAEAWLLNQRASAVLPKPGPVAAAGDGSPVVLVVACPSADVAAKLERLSAMMGCQTEGL